jgi:CRISPR-associated protein Csd2
MKKEIFKMNNRYDFLFFIQAKNCNPNGDPDMGNTPRIDPETMQGIITDVAIKRRIRNYIEIAFEDKEGYEIIKKEASNMNKSIAEVVLEVNDGKIDKKNGNKKVAESSKRACEKYFDVRCFGDVLTTGLNAGQIRGPVQLEMAYSLDPIMPLDITITRMCYTKGESDKLEDYDDIAEKMSDDKKRTMGRKQYIPYGLYIVRGSISANLAEKTGFNEEDLKILFEAIINMYTNDKSATKSGMSVLQPMIIFKHVGVSDETNLEQKIRESKLGCAPDYKLHELVNIHKKDNIEYPRNYTDYEATVEISKLPKGVEIGFKYGPFDDIVWNKVSENDNWFKEI